MRSKVLVRSGINVPPEEEIDEAIKALGDGWRIVQASTAMQIFGIVEDSGQPPAHHCSYVTTVVLEKENRRI